MRGPQKNRTGFTLIEILIVIGIIAILAGIVVVAINPAKQFAQARNAQRTSNINAILNAIGQRMADNKGIFPSEFSINNENYTCPTLPDNPTNITEEMANNSSQESADLGCLVPTYLPAIPSDPTNPSGHTGYTIELLENGRIEICSPLSASPENEPSLPDSPAICVTR